MKRKLFIFVFLIIFVNLGRSQTAEGFFHLGANLYIKGQFNQAVQVVQEGLKRFPNDPLLKALAEKLKQKKQQQQQQNQQQQEQQQKKEQQKKAAEQKKKEQQEKQKRQQAQKQQGKKKEMSKEEAERILRALKEENKKFKKEHLRVPAGRRQLDKNW